MKKKIGPVLVAVLLIVIVAGVGIASTVIKKYTPSKEVMSSKEYFGVTQEKELAVVLEDHLAEAKGLLEDEIAYLPYQAVKEYLNERFYWDAGEHIMVYTTPEDIIHILPGEKSYTRSDTQEERDYTIVKVDGTEVYLAAPFVQEYTNMEYTLLAEPNRLVITHEWGSKQYANMKKEGAVRYQGGIKSPILTQVDGNTKVQILETLDSWSKVRTEDGYIGYIENRKLGESYEETVQREFEEPVYTSLVRDHKINLIWHIVSNQESNDMLQEKTARMKGVNVISPTWFSIINNEGEISSLASEDYVSEAHSMGLEVWGLVSNFEPQVSTTQVLSSTTARERLSEQLIAQAILYQLEGINIDFEYLKEEDGDGYIQFLREMSVKCRKNGIVLSVDDPVPMPFNTFFNRKEQGIVTDYVIIMGYDEHYNGSEQAGSVASLSFERNGIKDTLAEVPAEKIISGVPFYTRLWKTDAQGNVSSETMGMDTADQWLADHQLTANWSEETSQDYAEFVDSDGSKYQIWLENERSLEEKAKLVKEYQLGGIAAWCLSWERPSIWPILEGYIKE